MSRKTTFRFVRSAGSDESRTDTNCPFGYDVTFCRCYRVYRQADRYGSLLAINDWRSTSDKQIETVESDQRTQNKNNAGAGDGHF